MRGRRSGRGRGRCSWLEGGSDWRISVVAGRRAYSVLRPTPREAPVKITVGFRCISSSRKAKSAQLSPSLASRFGWCTATPASISASAPPPGQPTASSSAQSRSPSPPSSHPATTSDSFPPRKRRRRKRSPTKRSTCASRSRYVQRRRRCGTLLSQFQAVLSTPAAGPSSSTTVSPAAVASAAAPSPFFPLIDPAVGWARAMGVGKGLENLGNTCFLNSALQVLLHTAPLVRYLTTDKHDVAKCA